MQIVLFLLCIALLLMPPAHAVESDGLTVALDRDVVILSPATEEEPAVLGPGLYIVRYAGNSILEVTNLSTRQSTHVAGITIEHHEALTAPVALSVADDQSSLHIILLLPNGKGVDVVGRRDGVGSRGISSDVIASSRIHTAINQQRAIATGGPTAAEKPLIVVAKAEEMRPENLLARIQDLERRLEVAERQLGAMAHHTHTYNYGTPGLTTTQGVKMILENNSPSIFAVWQPGMRFGCSACETSWPKLPENR